MMISRSALAAIVALGAASAAWAQTPAPPAPQQPPTSPAPAPPPRTTPPAPVARPALEPAAPAATAPVRPAPARPGLPLDSMRAAMRVPAAPAAVPANVVARCTDGFYVVSPATASACGPHGGVRVMMPQRSAPPAAVARVTVAPAALQATPSAAPPAGATMRCKDGTWLSGAPAANRCDANGGVAAILPAAPQAPPPPSPRRP